MIPSIKAWAFGIGLAVVLVGMALALRWLVLVAIGFLAVAFLLRFFTKRSAEET